MKLKLQLLPRPGELNLLDSYNPGEIIWKGNSVLLSKGNQDKPICVDQFKLFIDKDNVIRSQGRICLADLLIQLHLVTKLTPCS